ncbi:MAG: DUF4340 domain-containing protein [Bdellovibrionales bacterium]|nr:DUF4340 domain-containing protein [Bdellovibrionales bacterium]
MLGKRSLFPLFFFVCAFGVWQLSSHIRHSGSHEPSVSERSLFAPESVKDLKSIDIHHSQGRYSFFFASDKEGSALAGFQWRVTMPHQKSLDGHLIAQTLRLLFATRIRGVSQGLPSGSFVDYGLEDPSLVLTITSADGQREVSFGKPNPYLDVRYVSLSDLPGVWSVPESLYTTLRRQAEDFYQKELFSFSWELVDKVTFIGASESFHLSKRSNKAETQGWEIDGSPADTVFVENYLQSLFSLPLRYPEVLREGGWRAALHSPLVQLVLSARSENGTRFSKTLIVGGEVANSPRLYYASLNGEDIVFAFSEQSLRRVMARKEMFLLP